MMLYQFGFGRLAAGNKRKNDGEEKGEAIFYWSRQQNEENGSSRIEKAKKSSGRDRMNMLLLHMS